MFRLKSDWGGKPFHLDVFHFPRGGSYGLKRPAARVCPSESFSTSLQCKGADDETKDGGISTIMSGCADTGQSRILTLELRLLRETRNGQLFRAAVVHCVREGTFLRNLHTGRQKKSPIKILIRHDDRCDSKRRQNLVDRRASRVMCCSPEILFQFSARQLVS